MPSDADVVDERSQPVGMGVGRHPPVAEARAVVAAPPNQPSSSTNRSTPTAAARSASRRERVEVVIEVHRLPRVQQHRARPRRGAPATSARRRGTPSSRASSPLVEWTATPPASRSARPAPAPPRRGGAARRAAAPRARRAAARPAAVRCRSRPGARPTPRRAARRTRRAGEQQRQALVRGSATPVLGEERPVSNAPARVELAGTIARGTSAARSRAPARPARSTGGRASTRRRRRWSASARRERRRRDGARHAVSSRSPATVSTDSTTTPPSTGRRRRVGRRTAAPTPARRARRPLSPGRPGNPTRARARRRPARRRRGRRRSAASPAPRRVRPASTSPEWRTPVHEHAAARPQGRARRSVSSPPQVDELAGGHHPLLAPSVSPLMKCFCSAMYTASVGRAIIIEAAAMRL